MKWMPKWIGRVYSKLWVEFKENPFNFDQAKKMFGKYTPNYLSEIRKAQALFVFKKIGRKRMYRLIPPDLFMYSYANDIDLGWLKQGSYANLILKIFFALNENLGKRLLSLGVYGSIARNGAKNDSDLDLFLVSRDLPINLGERLDILREVKKKKIIQHELKFLNANQFYPRIAFYPRMESELKMSFFTIDRLPLYEAINNSVASYWFFEFTSAPLSMRNSAMLKCSSLTA